MKYAIISDIHANLEALEVCMREIDRLKPDRVICLGDIVDYCAEPNEAAEIIKQRADVVILGNHDEAQFNYSLSERFSENAGISSVHTRSVINPAYIEYFRGLKYFHTEENLMFTHSSPLEPEKYRYVRDVETAAENFNHFSGKVCFIGHSHKPIVFENTGKEIHESKPGKLQLDCRYIINVGSVGQPRDNNPLLSFGFYDSEIMEYRNIRLEYDVRRAAKKIISEGLPLFLAERLYTGI